MDRDYIESGAKSIEQGPSPVTSELMRIDEVIQALSKQMERLRTRIAPALNPLPRNDRGAKETSSGGSELYGNLASKRHRLESISDEISALTSECEI